MAEFGSSKIFGDLVVSGQIINSGAHEEGYNTAANGQYSHAEGYNTTASGGYSHTEGANTATVSEDAHAEGNSNLSGQGTSYKIITYDDVAKTITLNSVSGLSVGNLLAIAGYARRAPYLDVPITAINGLVVTLNTAYTLDANCKWAVLKDTGANCGAHVEGNGNVASGFVSHAEGYRNIARGEDAHAEGQYTEAVGDGSHTEGDSNTASTKYSHAEGKFNLASHGTLYTITAFNNTAKTITLDKVDGIVVGDVLDIKIGQEKDQTDVLVSAINGLVVTLNTTLTITSWWDYAIRRITAYSHYPVHAEGYNTLATGNAAHVEGSNNIASGDYSHAEGGDNIANNEYTHAEGGYTKATGSYSHSEGYTTTASGYVSHAEGGSTTASEYCSHAEGDSSIASGNTSHAEGSYTTASGYISHAEGESSISSGDYSHAQNQSTTSQGFAQTTIGRYNILQGTSNSFVSTDQAFIIGNGTSTSNRSNALSVDWSGNINAAGLIRSAVKTATITTTWTGTVAPYTQTIAVTGITVNDNPIVTPIYNATLATALLEKEAWNMISKIETGANSITVTCFETKPTTAINIQIK